MAVHNLRRPTNYPSGISAGGGSTGCDIMPQRTILAVRVRSVSKLISLPAGTILLSTVLMPDPENPATTGDIAISRVTGGAQTELAASAAETPLITPYSPMVRLSTDTEYEVVPSNSPDGWTSAGFEVILPRIRP